MLTVTEHLRNYPESRCGFSCALNVLGNNPLTNDFRVNPDCGYDDYRYVAQTHNTCLKVSFVPPVPDYKPEWNERLTVINLPTGDCLWITEVIKHENLGTEEVPEDEGTRVEHTLIPGAYTVGFPAAHQAAQCTTDYMFLVLSMYTPFPQTPDYHCIFNSEKLVNLSYPEDVNPRIRYKIFAKKELIK